MKQSVINCVAQRFKNSKGVLQLLLLAVILFFNFQIYGHLPSGYAVVESVLPEKETFAHLLGKYEAASGGQKVALANNIMSFLLEEEFTDEPLEFKSNTHPDSLNSQIWYWSAEWYYAHNKFKRAMEYGLKSLPLCEGTDMEADCLNILSLSYFRLSKYEQAAEYAKRCYKLDEKSGNKDIMSSSLNTIAGIYLAADQPREAEKYILKAIGLAKYTDNLQRMSVLCGMASEIYHAQGNNTEALIYIDRACDIEKGLGRETRLMVRLVQKASVLLGLEKYQQAEDVLDRVIPFFREKEESHSLAISCNKMGTALMAQERNEEAVKYFGEAAEIFLELGDKRNEMHSRKGLYESLWDSDSQRARTELGRFNDLKDSLYNTSTAESLARYNAEFGSDWLKLQIGHQKVLAKVIMLVSSVLLLTVALGIWWFMKRKMQMHNAALQTVIDNLKDSVVKSEEISPDKSGALSQTDRYFLEHLVTYITENMGKENISVEDLSSRMCITRGQLNRKVKSVTGLTTQQYISRVRMEYAKILLEHSPELSIYNISCKCGFEDATSFSRAFKRTFNITPMQSRNALQE